MIIGITGTDGAGKGAVTQLLVEEYGFVHYTVRAEIEAGIARRSLPSNRANMRIVANEMRAKNGNDVLIRRAIERKESEGAEKVIVESVRALAEVHTLKENDGVLLAVDADPEIRYKRIVGRGSASDNVSYEEFLAHEELEKNDPDPNGMQKAAVMEAADYTICNNGTWAELQAQTEAFLRSVGL